VPSRPNVNPAVPTGPSANPAVPTAGRTWRRRCLGGTPRPCG
jgi:hypothetical protein